MKIHVVFYGRLKQDVGAKTAEIDLAQDGLTVHDLAGLLEARYPVLRERLGGVAFAVNDTIVADDYCLRDGDEAALLPPVSGG
ncbi:MAG: MoaD/ThiS family protein [Chloroflexi bacterium]|jgi:molybdopterin converting factor subunit 1|nr:MoaD/ThiS family protein [Chloroflexota bacterium]